MNERCPICGGPKYEVVATAGGFSMVTECPCVEVKAEVTEDLAVAESVMRTGGELMTVGRLFGGETCPCCNQVVLTTGRDRHGDWVDNSFGAFYHNGRMTWVCEACWDRWSPKEPYWPQEWLERMHTAQMAVLLRRGGWTAESVETLPPGVMADWFRERGWETVADEVEKGTWAYHWVRWTLADDKRMELGERMMAKYRPDVVGTEYT